MSAFPPLTPTDPAPLLELRGVVKQYRSRGLLGLGPTVHAVNGVSLGIAAGETLGLVGESGSGKSTLGRVAIALEPPTAGEVRFRDRPLGAVGKRVSSAVRRELQIVFQDPYTSLDPRLPVGASVAEGLEIHRLVPRGRIRGRVEELLQEVGLGGAEPDSYPHEFSGGQRQRIGIARALAVEPSLLVCDEPVSALDVSVRAQVLNLLRDLQARRGLACLFIGHDLAVVAQVAHRIAVMYLGFIVELGPTENIITRPRHPYTVALLSAVPSPDPHRRRARIVLAGDPPSPTRIPEGCPFESRCYHHMRDARCRIERPALRGVGGSEVACHYAEFSPLRTNDQRPTTNDR